MNKNANSPPPYSMLNPDTSSDSPSAKSKGARLVSAKHLINHIDASGNRIITYQIVCAFFISNKLNDNESIRTVINTSAIVTS